MSLGDDIAGLTGRVLVVMDFDGTLAEIVDRPEDARAVPGSLEVLARLAERPDTEVAVVSGRSMEDLGRLAPVDGVVLVGEHGAAWQHEEPVRPERFEEILEALERAATLRDGAWVEVKKASLVLHTRALDPAAESEVVGRALAGLDMLGHRHFHFGKHVLDVGFSDTSKGQAVAAIRRRLGCDTVVFAGDDTTDETVFETLGPGDIGVKVGAGDTAADHRVNGPEDVVALLEALADR